jgi:hypothetical protein
MFIIGLALAMGGYAVAYYALNVMTWSRSSVANQSRPVPLKYVLGVPVPTTGGPDMTPFHPIFTIADLDRANAVYAMGGAGAPTPSALTPEGLAQTPGLGVIPGITPGGI